MTDKTKIAIRNAKGDLLEEVPVLYRRGSIIVHMTLWSESDPHGYTVTNENCGFAYRQGFYTEAGATAFADYIASIPELAAIKVPEEATKLKESNPEIT